MKYKMIISDFDGTLQKSGENFIDKQVVCAIKQFEKNGGRFIICSGRPIASIKQIAQKSGLGGVMVGLQGSVIKNLDTDESIGVFGLEKQTAIEIITSFKTENGEVIVYVGDDLYYEKEADPTTIYQNMLNVKGTRVDNIIEFVKNSNLPVCKIGILTDAETVKELLAKYSENFKGREATFNSGYKYMLEVVNPNYAKGYAVRFLSKYYNIPLDKIMTVGDSTNDYALLSGEWHGVCVGDGHPDLKKIAKEITVPLEEKPIKILIEKYCAK